MSEPSRSEREFNLSEGLSNQKHSDNPIIDNILQKRASEEFNLSKNIYKGTLNNIYSYWISDTDVKEFLRIGNDLITDLEFGRITIQEFRERFNKNAGEKLCIKQEKKE